MERILDNQWYDDASIYCTIKASDLLDDTCLFIDSLTNADHRLKKTVRSPLLVIAPVNRNNNHWVLYILQRETVEEPFTWMFGDSIGFQPAAKETNRITRLLDSMTTDLSHQEPNLHQIISMDVPRQQDLTSCGAYVTEAILRFLRNRWPSASALREKHAGRFTPN